MIVNLFLTVVELEIKIKVPVGFSVWRASGLYFQDGILKAASSRWNNGKRQRGKKKKKKRVKLTLSNPFMKSPNLIYQEEASCLNRLLKATPPNTVALGLSFDT
jgi:hypothetical protein